MLESGEGNQQQGTNKAPAMGPAPFWSLKPAKRLHPKKLDKRKNKPKRLGSLEAWRSDKILDAVHARNSPKKSPPKLQIDPLSVVGSKPTASSPLFSQLPGARGSPQASPTGNGGKLRSPGSNQSPKGGVQRGLQRFPSPAGTPGSLRRKKEIEGSPSSSLHSPLGMSSIPMRMTPESSEYELMAGHLGREKEAAPVKGAEVPSVIDMGTPVVALGPAPPGPYGGKPKPNMPPPVLVAPEAAPPPLERVRSCERLEEGVLMGKLMETEMTLRLKFDAGKELRRVEGKVNKGLDFLEELPKVSAQLGIIEGLLFQELLARLNLMSPANFATATTPASPTLRALRQENCALGGGSSSPAASRPLVNRTPLPGQNHPAGPGKQPEVPSRPMQEKVEALGYDKQQRLLRNVANLRGLVRIKIEDNGDLALAKKALEDARLVFDNVWALAGELPADSVDSTQEETSWPPSPGEDPSLDARVAKVLVKLRS